MHMADNEFEKNLSEERKTKLAALLAALIEGEQSGASASFDFDRFLERKRRDAHRP